VLTAAAVAVNATEANPARTVAEEGTVRLVLLLLRVTTVPPAGATALSVTVHVVLWPAPNAIGAQLTDDSCAGAARFRVNVCELPLALAVTTAIWSVVTDPTFTVNPAVVVPTGTVTLPGTVALALLLESVTAKPPAGATAPRVTVQEDEPGAFTLPGAQLKLFDVTGCKS
jgi:hypothetical protein